MKRVFVAIDLPDHVKTKLFKTFVNLPKNLFSGKKTEKENLHLTLKFLGDVKEEEIEKIKNKLKGIKFNKFSCEVGKAGFFDDEEHIKVIWVELISDEIKELQKLISKELPEFFDEKEFNSHITLARVGKVLGRKKLVEEIGNIHFKNLDFEIDGFVLMKSELFPKGPKYKIIEKFPLL